MRKPPLRLPAFATVLALAALATACAGRRIDHRVDRTRPETGRIGFTQSGQASWYGGKFHGRRTASGETYDQHGLTAAHRELPLGTWIDVTHLANGRTVRVKVNDRGPFIRGRFLDLSRGAAESLGMLAAGVAHVRIRVVAGPATARRQQVAADSGGHFSVQVGAFRDRDRALDLKLTLDGAYRDVEITTTDGWHRVRVGRFDHRADADDLRRHLARAGHDVVIVTLETTSSYTCPTLSCEPR